MSYVVHQSSQQTQHSAKAHERERSPLGKFVAWCVEKLAGTAIQKPMNTVLINSLLGRIIAAITVNLIVGALLDLSVASILRIPLMGAVSITPVVIAALAGGGGGGLGGAVVGFFWGWVVGQVVDASVSETVSRFMPAVVMHAFIWLAAAFTGWIAGCTARWCFDKLAKARPRLARIVGIIAVTVALSSLALVALHIRELLSMTPRVLELIWRPFVVLVIWLLVLAWPFAAREVEAMSQIKYDHRGIPLREDSIPIREFHRRHPWLLATWLVFVSASVLGSVALLRPDFLLESVYVLASLWALGLCLLAGLCLAWKVFWWFLGGFGALFVLVFIHTGFTGAIGIDAVTLALLLVLASRLAITAEYSRLAFAGVIMVMLLLLNLSLRHPASVFDLLGIHDPHPAGTKEMLQVSGWLGAADAVMVVFVSSCALIARRRAALIDRTIRVLLAPGKARTVNHNRIVGRLRRRAAFTERARRVVVLAQEEARMLNHDYIGTVHILLGLIREGEGAAAKALESQGISLGAVRQQAEEISGRGQWVLSGHIPFSPLAKKALELSLREAQQLGHHDIGTEHLLLGLIREGDVAAQVLVKLGADLNRMCQQAIQLTRANQAVTPARSKQDQLRELHATIAHLTQAQDRVQAAIAAHEQARAKLESQVGQARRGGRKDRVHDALTRLSSRQSQVDDLKSGVDRLLADRVKLTTMAQALQAEIDGAGETTVVLDQFGRNLTQSAREVTSQGCLVS